MSTILKTAAGEASKRWTAPLKVLYFRHAYSHWNKFKDNLDPNSGKQDWIDLDEKFVDAQLTVEEGIDQVLTLSNDLTPHIKNIRTVFVSPLVRAIQTADIAFGQHAEHKNIQFIIHPLLMPRIGHPTDLALFWESYIRKSIVHFDTDLLQALATEPAWQFKYLLQQQVSNQNQRSALEIARQKINSGKDSLESSRLYNSYFNQNNANLSENDEQLGSRLNKLAESIHKYTNDNSFSPDDSFVIVSHGGIIKKIFGKKPRPCELSVTDTSKLSI
jgi:broad specificity phosphatase PhoE